MPYTTVDELKTALGGVVELRGDHVEIKDEAAVREQLVDRWVRSAVFGDEDVKQAARWLVRAAGQAMGLYSASIQSFYDAMGREEISGLTVPAINIRGMTYDMARSVCKAAGHGRVGAVIFEIARSEIGYTEQRPAEFLTVVAAAAIREGFTGPLFVQGDHFQVNAKKYAEDPEKEVNAVRDLIREAVGAGFLNIDIDTSTLVDLSKPTQMEQQRANFERAAELTALIRELEPPGVTISVGGEIGEVGGKNSTVEELRAFMDGYLEALAKKGEGLKGISKISVQTGTTHGGVPLPDGTIAKVALDFDVLKAISQVARRQYGLCGAVQHGASTLPDEAFNRFTEYEAGEVHLATGFQNIFYDNDRLPGELKQKMYEWLKRSCASEWKEGLTEEQFIYKTRKKAFGPFKRDVWDLPLEVRSAINAALEEKFAFLFAQLKVLNTTQLVAKHVEPVACNTKAPASIA